MALTKLSVSKGVEVAFSDRRSEIITEARVLLMRDGKDFEAELEARQKKPDDLAFTLSRTPLGDVEVTVTTVKPRGPLRG